MKKYIFLLFMSCGFSAYGSQEPIKEQLVDDCYTCVGESESLDFANRPETKLYHLAVDSHGQRYENGWRNNLDKGREQAFKKLYPSAAVLGAGMAVMLVGLIKHYNNCNP